MKARGALQFASVALAGLLVAATVTVVAPHMTYASDAYSTAILADTPLIYYRLDETSGSSAADLSGNGQTGTYGAGTGFSVPGAIVGSTDTAIQAPGSGAWAVTQSGATLPTGGAARTYEVWFETASSYTHSILETGDQSNHMFDVNLSNTDQIILDGDGGTSATLITPNVYTDGAWHLLDVETSASSQSVYLDGQEIGTATLTVATSASQPLLIDNGGADSPVARHLTSLQPTARS